MRRQRSTRSIQWQMATGALALSLGGALGIGSLAWAEAPLDEEGVAKGRAIPQSCAIAEGTPGATLSRRFPGETQFPGKEAIAATVNEANRARKLLCEAALIAKRRATAAENAACGTRADKGNAPIAEGKADDEASERRLDAVKDSPDEAAAADVLQQAETACTKGSCATDDPTPSERPCEPDAAPDAQSPTNDREDHEALREQAPSSEPAQTPPESESENPQSTPRTITINGTVIPYCDVRGGTTPSTGGGLWRGSDAVDDGSWGYFVGHNPGSFAPVKQLGPGSVVAVRDSTGAERTYTVCDKFTVDATATWKSIANRVTGHGESIALQTCNDDGSTVTIIVAA